MAGRQPLLYGYKIALFYESLGESRAENGRMGYLQSTWSTGPQSAAPIGMVPLGSRNATPPNIEDCIYQIVSGDGEIHQAMVKSKSVEEVKFGQIIRLVHVGQGKPLCCSKRRGGISDKNSKKVTIEPISNLNTRRDWTSKWRIAPRYQVRGEGEKVCDGDNITLQPMISAGMHFLSVGELNIRGSTFLEASSVPKDCRDLDGVPREMGLTIKAYDTEDLEGDALRGGDCIMLYHKEKCGYLLGTTLDNDSHVVLQPDSLRTAVEDKDPATYLSNGMFIVEWEDPLQGGAMQAASWNENRSGMSQRFRLRLLGNGDSNFYLSLRRRTEEEQAKAERRRSSTSVGIQAQASWYKTMQQRKKASIEERAAERLPGWVTTLCKLEDLKLDKGTLFRFLQTGDNTEVELHHTSRVIIWADQAGMKGEPSESVFVHVGTAGSRGGFTVGCSSRPLQKDGFELQRVPPDAFLSLNSVLSQIPPINEYTKELDLMAEDDHSTKLHLEPERLLSSLEEMITRCYGTSYTVGVDVLELDSTPDKVQQLLLVDQDVPRSCLKLLQAQERLPFSPEELLSLFAMQKTSWGLAKRVSIAPAEVQPPRSSLRIARLCYKLIGSAVRGSTELAARVAVSIGEDGLEFVRSQGTYRNDLVGAIPCLVSLYENNRAVQLATPQGFVNAVCDQVKRQKWRSENLRLLPYLISTETDVVERSCHVVADELLSETNQESTPFISMKSDDGKLSVRIPFDLGVGDEDNETPSWIPIEDFCDVSDDIKCREIRKKPIYTAPSMSSIAIRLDDIFEYFRYQLILFSRLCLGKGSNAKHRAATINTFIPQQCIMMVLCDQAVNKIVPDGLQCAFMKLACTVLLDDHPNKHYHTLHIVKVWDRFDEEPFELGCPVSIQTLKQKTLGYINSTPTHDCHFPTTIEKSIGYMQMLTFFVRSGFVTQNEIFTLSIDLTVMLDGTTDTYLEPERPVPSNTLRKMYTEYSKELLLLRDMIITCLGMLLDYKNSRDTTKVLTVIKKHIDKGAPVGDLDLPHLSQLQSYDPEDDIDKQSESNFVDEDENLLFKGFGMLKGGVSEGLGALSKVGNLVGLGDDDEAVYSELNTLLEVLLDCAQYDHHQLRISATRLLFRLTNRGPHVAAVLKNAQLLSSDRSIKFYTEANDLVEKLQELLEDTLDTDENIEQVKEIATELNTRCFLNGKHSVEQQWILIQLDFHTLLLSTPWMAQSEAYTNAESNITDTMTAICKFLIAAVTDNPENKDALDEYIEMFSKLLPFDVGALELLKVIYEGSTKRCILAPDNLIRALLATPVKASYTDFLMDIMRPERRNLFRKQQTVYAHASDMWTHECNFVGSSEMHAWTGRKKLRSVDEKIRLQEYLDPYGKVASHFLVLQLLRAISKGKEVALKREIRADIWTEKYADPAEHVMNVVSKHELPVWYRASYVRFFTEVMVDDKEFIQSIVTQKMHDGKWGIVKILHLLKNDVGKWPVDDVKPVVKKDKVDSPQVDTLSPKSAGVTFEKEATPDVIAGVHLNGPQVFDDYLFFGVLPMVKHFVAEYLGKRQNQTDHEQYQQITQLISEIVQGYYNIITTQKNEMRNVSPPGMVEEENEVCGTVSYSGLIKYAQNNPGGGHHPAAKANGKLLSPYIRTKLAELMTIMTGYQEQLTFQIPPAGSEGISAYQRPKITPRVVTAEEELFVKWRECIKKVNEQPSLESEKQFRTLSLILLRKGNLGKEFIKKTLIGAETEGVIFEKDTPMIQLDGLRVLSRLCDDFDPVCLGEGKGADDASIIIPYKRLYVKTIREEEAGDEDERYALSDSMDVIDKQNTLNSFGMSEKLVSLVDAPSATSIGISNTTMTALKTGSALLSGGNSEVQESIIKYFLKKNDENFFIHIRGQLRKFSDSLKDLTRTLKKEVTARTKESTTHPDDAEEEPPMDLKKEPIPADIIPTMKERYCVGQIDVVLRFLQLLTEGHNLAMQNYLREQPDNHTSIDLVEAVVTFLQQIKYLNRITASIMSSTLNTLIEFVQGPCHDNQEELISHNIGEQICKILNDAEGPMVYKADLITCGESEAFEDLWDIRCAAVQLLVSCVEGCVSFSNAQLLLSTVRLEVLAENMNASYKLAGFGKSGSLLSSAFGAGVDIMQDLIKPEGTGSELEDRLNLGCNIFIFFKVMLDTQALKEGEVKEPVVWHDKEGRSIKQVLRRDENSCFEHFNQTVATIEVARGDGVERVYFRVLMKSKLNLPERSKNDVKNEVQRDSGDGVRVADFFDKCIGLIHEIDYYEEMRNTRGLALIHKFSVPLEWLSLFLSFTINAYLLSTVFYYNDDTEANVETGDEEEALDLMGRGIIVLQCLQMIHFGMGPTRIYLDFKWREWEQQQEDDAMRESKVNLSIHTVNRESFGKDKLSPIWVFLQTVHMVISFWPFWQRGVYLICSFLGYYVSPMYYCIQPLQVIAFSPKLMNVVLAVTTNGKSLLLTFGLMLIFVNIFASWAFFRFSNYFDEDGDFGAGFNCDSLFRCWVLLMTYGLRQGGGMGDILSRPNWSDERIGERILFDVLYFLVLIILFLNIVFGIIIDTFAELRERREFIDDDQQSKCFICGMERSVFDREAGSQGGFEHHYKNEHNMWTYLLFLHYVKEKNVDDLTGQEKYVYDMVVEKDPGFFPIGKALVLRSLDTADPIEQILEKMVDKGQLEKLQTSLSTRWRALEKKLGSLVVPSGSIAPSLPPTSVKMSPFTTPQSNPAMPTPTFAVQAASPPPHSDTGGSVE